MGGDLTNDPGWVDSCDWSADKLSADPEAKVMTITREAAMAFRSYLIAWMRWRVLLGKLRNLGIVWVGSVAND